MPVVWISLGWFSDRISNYLTSIVPLRCHRILFLYNIQSCFFIAPLPPYGHIKKLVGQHPPLFNLLRVLAQAGSFILCIISFFNDFVVFQVISWDGHGCFFYMS